MTVHNVVLCPGQGAQAVGMGKAWHGHSPVAREVFERADAIVGDQLGRPLSAMCFDGPAEQLNRTDVAQPALYVAGVASFRALFGENGRSICGAGAGLSLGEYTALHLAGCFSFEVGLELVCLRGRAMQDAAEASPSSMVALAGATDEQALEICDRASTGDVLVPANFNAPGQIVISGSADACQRALGVASEVGLRAVPLSVAGAFHSPLMESAAQRLEQAIGEAVISPPDFPVISNVTGLPHEPEPDSIRTRLVEQLTCPVRWSDSCQWLVSNAEGEYHELAPGRVLSGLMRRIHRATKVTSHDGPDS